MKWGMRTDDDILRYSDLSEVSMSKVDNAICANWDYFAYRRWLIGRLLKEKNSGLIRANENTTG